MNEKAFVRSLLASHDFFSRQFGLAEPLAGPTSLPANTEFNRIALDTERPYTDVFFAGLKLGQYNFALTDFSYFQFSYTSEEDVRYAFYPSPFTTDALAQIAQLQQRLGARDAADVEMLMTFAESQPVNYRRPVVRYEYNVEQYDAGIHPVSHIHIGTYGDDRWVLQPRLTPLAFALVIAKLYFRPHWEAVTEGEGEKRTNEFDHLLEKERGVCAPTPDDKFAHEIRAFYMA